MDLVTIRMVGLPVPVQLEAAEHADELLREFALIAGDETSAEVPARLTALMAELRARFSGFTVRTEAELADAVARGADTVDLEYELPRDAVEAAGELIDLLDEADEFCRAGELLTLATPPAAVRYRRWFSSEFARQAAGEPPTPWADWTG